MMKSDQISSFFKYCLYNSTMKLTKTISSLLIVVGGVFLWGILFLHPLSVFSQDDAGTETAVSTPSSTKSSELAIPHSQKLNEALLAQVIESEPSDPIRYIVYLEESVDVKQVTQHIEDEEIRHTVLVEQLQQTANQSQAALLNEMDSLQQAGSITTYRSLWIINAVATEGTIEGMVQLANRADVARIVLDEERPLIVAPDPVKEMQTMWQTAILAASGQEPWGIERIRAAHAWQGLGIDGDGITVGIMDSGVDWQHPDLLANYRGNLGAGTFEHTGNWYDAAVPTITVPHDVLGHGTHVAGTAVGQNGIGVAPGASWIAVNISNEGGYILDSYAHAAFQWLLAPANNPALAPDVINGSWSGSGDVTIFLPDIQALDAAGIIPVFAAGNNGPEAGTIGSPGSFMETIAVGAHDDTDTLTWFSSRGPSPLHEEFQPQLVAPGATIYSSLPDGMYGYYNGTSMAAPHTTGAVALMLAADNALSRPEVTHILTETAVSISSLHPNLNSGWGRLDAYQAVTQITPHGTLTGLVHEAGQPQAGVVVTVTTSVGDDLAFITDENGRYTAQLQPGTYHLTTNPFGFEPLSVNNITLTTGTTTSRDLALTQLPSGTLDVQVLEAITRIPVQATIAILNTPLTLETSDNGSLNLQLPAGDYDLQISKTGYEIAIRHVTIRQNQTANHTITLTPTKSVLLVDTGGWHYGSYREYYAQSLLNLGYAYDSHVITNPLSLNFPAQSQINDYDVMVWTAPRYSPGYINANSVITDFLGQGGNLFISGQNIGAYDGYSYFTQIWWYRDLQAYWQGKTAVTQTITGASNTNYDGLTITLNGNDSANNQTDTDIASPRPMAFSEPIFYADDGSSVGLQAGHCKPFRMSFLGFGLEGVSEAADRDEILAQSFAYFDTPRLETGLRWRPETIDDLAPLGNDLVYPVHMQHLGELITDTYSLRIDDALWPVSLNTTSVELGPCKNDLITITVQIPDNLPRNLAHDFTITAVSQNDPSVQVSLPIHHKTPGHMLLVDDDRWFEQEEIYRSALTDAGFTFDEWKVGGNNEVNRSPSTALLNSYNYVIWFTGYDWFAPVNPQENESLSAYLKQGGRLFLSSQDFLYYNHKTPLAQNQLGVFAYQESVTPTQAFRGHSIIPTNLNEPLPITYGEFQNNSDGLTPSSSAVPFMWHDKGLAAGIANSIPAASSTQNPGLSRSIFFGFPFEKLPEESRSSLMSSIVGWLTDVGDSSFEVDQRSSHPNDTRTYTITLRNHPLANSNQLFMTNTLPISLTLQPATLTGAASYEASSRQIRWQGQLNSGEVHTITYQARPSQPLPDNTRIDNLLTIGFDSHALTFEQIVSFWINSPDLSQSNLNATQSTEASTQYVTYTLSLQNSDVSPAEHVTATLRLPEYLKISRYTISSQAGQYTKTGSTFIWTGNLAPSELLTITVAANRQVDIHELEWLTAVAYLEDGSTNPIVKAVYSHLPPRKYYFPFVFQND